jgi:hypothetical protein
MPKQAAPMPPFFPDPAGPALDSTGKIAGAYTTYVFGFRNMTGHPDEQLTRAKNHAQISAPLFTTQVGQDLRLTLHNLGLANRPDLIDSHTIHFHGFSNQIAYFDGVPDASLSVPIGRFLEYRYIPEDAGTYMWHCHVEDVEHVQMGMNGLCFIAPAMGQNYAYENASTRFDRQFSIHLSEIFAQGHYGDRHSQDTDWTDYTGTFRLMNGRAWPDTIYPNLDPINLPSNPTEDDLRLRYQPQSSLIQGEAGETILVRLAHLGYEEHSLVLPGLPFTVIGRDAKYQGVGRAGYFTNQGDSTDPARANVETIGNRIDVGPGESRDLLITLPPNSGNTPLIFPFYDRNLGYTNPKTGPGASYGGQRTEIHVYPKGKLHRPGGTDLAITPDNPDYGAFRVSNNQITAWADGSPVVQRYPNQLF